MEKRTKELQGSSTWEEPELSPSATDGNTLDEEYWLGMVGPAKHHGNHKREEKR